jgi:hypothetical protein
MDVREVGKKAGRRATTVGTRIKGDPVSVAYSVPGEEGPRSSPCNAMISTIVIRAVERRLRNYQQRGCKFNDA